MALRGVRREEEHAHPIPAAGRQLDASVGACAAQEGVGHLDEDAGAVTRTRVAPGRATVREVVQKVQSLPHDLVRSTPLEVRDEPDAARVMLVRGVVEALPWRRAYGLAGRRAGWQIG